MIADLNFDGNEDIAVVVNVWSNKGYYYQYYLNTPKGYQLDPFLTDSVQVFPSKIDTVLKQIETQAVAGICGVGVHSFGYKNAKWSKLVYQEVNICK